MIREDRELLAELARVNTAMASLAMRIIDNSASAAEQHDYAQRLIAAGERLQKRADEMTNVIIDGEVLESGSLALSEQGIPATGPSSSGPSSPGPSSPICSIQTQPSGNADRQAPHGR